VIWTVIAAVASLVAAACAMRAVAQTAQLRQEARQQVLADALIAMISATEKNPGYGKDHFWDARVIRAVSQVERATALSLLGLSAEIKEPVFELLDPSNHKNPDRLFMAATKAFEEMRLEKGGAPIAAQLEPGKSQALVKVIFKRWLLKASDKLRSFAQKS
jgi:hypothetical protein